MLAKESGAGIGGDRVAEEDGRWRRRGHMRRPGISIRTLRVDPAPDHDAPAGDDEDLLGVLDVDRSELGVGADLTVGLGFIFEDAAVAGDEPDSPSQISIVAWNSPLPVASTLPSAVGHSGTLKSVTPPQETKVILTLHAAAGRGVDVAAVVAERPTEAPPVWPVGPGRAGLATRRGERGARPGTKTVGRLLPCGR